MGLMLNRRRVMGGSGLPYDAEIEYLESQGGCVILTGIVPTGTNITIKTKIYYIGYTDNSQYVAWFVAYTNESSSTYRVIRNRNYDEVILVNNSGRAAFFGTSVRVSPNTLYNIELYPGTGLINNSSFSLYSQSTPVNTGEMTLFSDWFKGRFYNFYMADGDNILLDLIPVRKGGVGYMYDKVSGQLFGNNGTGDFILGPDKDSAVIITQQQQYEMYGE